MDRFFFCSRVTEDGRQKSSWALNSHESHCYLSLSFSWYFLTKGIRDQCSDPHRSGISLISHRGLSYYRIKSNLPPAASVTDFTIFVFTTAKATPPSPTTPNSDNYQVLLLNRVVLIFRNILVWNGGQN